MQRLRSVGACCIGLVVWVLLMIAAGRGVAAEVELWISPDAEVGGTGGADDPLRTISAALGGLASASGQVTLHLAPGDYALSEEFPFVAPSSLDRLTIQGSSASSTRIRRESNGPVFVVGGELVGDGEEPPPLPLALRFELQGVSVTSADHGILAIAPPESSLVVRVEACEFHEQSKQAIEVVVDALAEADVRIGNCTVRGPFKYGLDLATRDSGSLSIDISGNRIEGVGEIPFRAGVSVFADEASRVTGRVARNRLRDAGDGIVIATADSRAKAVEVHLDVAGNELLASTPGSGMRHGVVVSVHDGHRLEATIRHNTFVGGSGHGFFLTAQDKFGETCAASRIAFERNVVLGFERGAFGVAKDLDASCVTLRSNAVDATDPLVEAGGAFGVSATDDLVDVAARDYRPRRGGALVDAGESGPFAEAALEELDVAGNCRHADGDGDGVTVADIGAHELVEGVICARELLPFTRGDCNSDAKLEISDAVTIFNYLFLSPVSPPCLDACDGNDDAEVNLSDGIYLLNFLFQSGVRPPAPYPEPGIDATADAMLCLRSSA